MEWQLLVGFATRGRWYHEIGDCAKTRQAKQALARVSTLLRRAAAQPLQGYLGGVLLGLVDVLAVVPEARRHADVTDVDTAGPSGTASSPVRELLVDGRRVGDGSAVVLQLLLPRVGTAGHCCGGE